MEAMSMDGGSGRGSARSLAARLRGLWNSARTQPSGEPGRDPRGNAAAGDEDQSSGGQARTRWPGRSAGSAEQASPVPSLLRNAAAWSWRLLLVAAVAYV